MSIVCASVASLPMSGTNTEVLDFVNISPRLISTATPTLEEGD